MKEVQKQDLISLGSEALADLVLDMGNASETGRRKMQRVVSSQNENIKMFKQRLNSLKNGRRHYISWREADAFAVELCDLLQDIQKGASSPEEGIAFVSDFFESDEFIFEMADDSNGCIGDVYRSNAFDLFVSFAKKCKRKQEVIETVVKLIMNDDYGVRYCLIEESHKFLDLKDLQELFDVISKRFHDKKGHKKWTLMSLAKQMKDASLFEKLMHEWLDKKVNGKHLVEIAEVYFESGCFEKAQSLIDSFSDKDSFGFDKKIHLQKKLFKATNKKAELKNLLMEEFKRYYSKSSLKELLDVVGQDKKQALCSKAIADILKNRNWDSELALFLIDCKAFDDAEKYLLKHIDSLDGDNYFSLVPIAEKMEVQKKYLSATLVYRELLDSILGRGKSKYYYHGVRYLKKLDGLKDSIKDWSHLLPHSQYYSNIRKEHQRKRAFWSQYEG